MYNPQLKQPHLNGLILTQEQQQQGAIRKTDFSHLVSGWLYLLDMV